MYLFCLSTLFKSVFDCYYDTHTNQSMANSNITSCVGIFRVFNTIMIIISVDDGTDVTANDEVKANKHTVPIWPTPKCMSFICAMNIAETEIITAVPSVLQFAPIGKMNFVMRWSILRSLCITWNVTGRAAALLFEKKMDLSRLETFKDLLKHLRWRTCSCREHRM